MTQSDGSLLTCFLGESDVPFQGLFQAPYRLSELGAGVRQLTTRRDHAFVHPAATGVALLLPVSIAWRHGRRSLSAEFALPPAGRRQSSGRGGRTEGHCESPDGGGGFFIFSIRPIKREPGWPGLERLREGPESGTSVIRWAPFSLFCRYTGPCSGCRRMCLEPASSGQSQEMGSAFRLHRATELHATWYWTTSANLFEKSIAGFASLVDGTLFREAQASTFPAKLQQCKSTSKLQP